QDYEPILSVKTWMLYKKLLPTKENKENRERLVKKIKRILSNKWPDHKINVHLFGSSVNLLGTSTSDIDLCVITPSKELENISALSVKLQKYNMEITECVTNAKVPIVKFWDPILLQNPIIICLVLNFLQMRYPPILPVLKVDRKNEDIDLLKVGHKNNESI
ncbi:32396_t:CDS:2, partial [Gigaspora margarita]